jgi:hypothetical protein
VRAGSVISRVSLLGWIALLLMIALAAVIAMVTLDDTVGAALAVSALVATVVAMVVVVLEELTEEEPPPLAARFAGRRLAAGLAVLAVVMLAVAAVVVSSDESAASTASDGTGAAVQTARDYVTAAAVDQDGEQACGYLAAPEQQRVARLAGPHATCREEFGDTGRLAPGIPGSVHAIGALAVTTTVREGRVRVVLGHGSGALSFVLRHATAAEGAAFNAPPSAWRITEGATSVLAA